MRDRARRRLRGGLGRCHRVDRRRRRGRGGRAGGRACAVAGNVAVEIGERHVRLHVRVGDVERCRDGHNVLERGLDRRVLLDENRHGVVVDFVCEHTRAERGVGAVLGLGEDVGVEPLDGLDGGAGGSDLSVVGVLAPDVGLGSQRHGAGCMVGDAGCRVAVG